MAKHYPDVHPLFGNIFLLHCFYPPLAPTEKEWMEQELKKADIDSWENKRLPRPWEPDTMANARPPTGTGTLAQQLEMKSAAK